ncbi:hypothetical protein GGR50DRAFT_696245 [Xylaria sp. CBS 124048]|nr:hypothetical protein GGR50DRAFT_696245 [Xylaria sp. CBS 124048]
MALVPAIMSLRLVIQNPNFKGYTNQIWLLLSNNADPDIRDNSDEYPLAKLFAGAGPNFTISGIGHRPQATGLRNQPLAASRQDKISAAMLLYKGTHVAAKTTSGTTLLIMMANQFKSELNTRPLRSCRVPWRTA